MLLAADIGNTHVHLGLFRGEALVATGKLRTDRIGDIDAEWARFAGAHGVDGVGGAIVCSVNPKVKIPFCHWVARTFGRRPLVVGENLKLDLPVRVESPDEVGADRVVNAYAALRIIGRGPIVIADFGTAITFDVVSAEGAYVGGAICPGVRTAARALEQQTALLPFVHVQKTASAIGRNTIDAINGGLYHGFMGLVDALCERIAKELNAVPRFLATGGDAALFADGSRHLKDVRPDLTLVGLRLAFEAAPPDLRREGRPS
jgi:type III pantothenate kinase